MAGNEAHAGILPRPQRSVTGGHERLDRSRSLHNNTIGILCIQPGASTASGIRSRVDLALGYEASSHRVQDLGEGQDLSPNDWGPCWPFFMPLVVLPRAFDSG